MFYFFKYFLINLCTLYACRKTMHIQNLSSVQALFCILSASALSGISCIMRSFFHFAVIPLTMIMLILFNKYIWKISFTQSASNTVAGFCINYSIYAFSAFGCALLFAFLFIDATGHHIIFDCIPLFIQCILVFLLFKIKRLKKGILMS